MTHLSLLNQLLLATFLFAVYFSVLCCLFCPSSQDKNLSGQSSSLYCLIEDKPSKVAAPKPDEQNYAASLKADIPSPQPLISEVVASPYADNLKLLDTLKKLQLRKLCKPLGIQQKCNGVELSLELMRAEVKRKFKQDPPKVMTVLQECLPDLFSTVDISAS